MEKKSICVGHIIRRCHHCIPNEHNGHCPGHKKVTLFVFEVKPENGEVVENDKPEPLHAVSVPAMR